MGSSACFHCDSMNYEPRVPENLLNHEWKCRADVHKLYLLEYFGGIYKDIRCIHSENLENAKTAHVCNDSWKGKKSPNKNPFHSNAALTWIPVKVLLVKFGKIYLIEFRIAIPSLVGICTFLEETIRCTSRLVHISIKNATSTFVIFFNTQLI